MYASVKCVINAKIEHVLEFALFLFDVVHFHRLDTVKNIPCFPGMEFVGFEWSKLEYFPESMDQVILPAILVCLRAN